MSGALPLLPTYEFMAWTRATLLLPLRIINHHSTLNYTLPRSICATLTLKLLVGATPDTNF
jgi:hypothetical protein